jgi:spoIIIJ-associated protein
MNQTEATGRTIEEATTAALGLIGATREEADVEVLQEPKPAILGFGGREARVRVTRQASYGTLARDVTTQMLGLMGYSVTAELSDEGPDGASIVLSGQDLSGLIGRHGRTLDALEFLVGMHVFRRRGSRVGLVIDAGGYRARREKALVEMAHQAAERATQESRPIALEPMEAKERRVVHLALRDDPRVATASEGEEGSRFVVVAPVTPDPAEDTDAP